MKKTISLSILILVVFAEINAQKYYTKTGELNFEASVDTFEPVKAIHKSTTAVIDLATGKIAVLALVKGFRFKNALMEEHFNENYMESSTLPKTKFNGVIKGFSMDDLKEGEKKKYTLQGELTIHGKTQSIETEAILIQKGEAIQLATNFSALPADYGIQIPSVVKEKIAGNINITGSFNLLKR